MADKELLEQFFCEARGLKLEDNGFSKRVMEQIPRTDTSTLGIMWTAFCIVVAAVLFVVFDGWQLVVNSIIMILKTQPTEQGLLMFAVSVGVVWLLAFTEVLTHERFQLI